MQDGHRYRFELNDAKSHKFWDIIFGQQFRARYGRVGTTGQAQTKPWPSVEICKREATKLIREKLRKGYVAVAIKD